MSATTVSLGDIRIEALIDVEGAFFPLQVVFPDVPPEDWEPYRSIYPDTFAGSEVLYTRVTCYLIRHRAHTILVDAGIGPGPEPLFGHASGRLLDQLAARGIEREQVDMVVLTHLHPDHVGWATVDDRPTFPRAKYLVSEIELETFQREDVRTAMHAIVPGYLDRCLVPLERSGVLEPIEPGTGIAPGIRIDIAPGHTPGMLRIEIDDAERPVWIVADTFTHPAQVDRPAWCSAFDMDRTRAIATRHTTIAAALSRRIVLLASHFPPTAGIFADMSGRLLWRAASD